MMSFLKRILLLIIWWVGSANASGQGHGENAGTATKLSGRIYVLTVFVTSGKWSTEEKTAEYQKIYEAQNWLVKQAARYGKEISFDGGNFGLNEPLRIPDMPVGAATGKEPTDLVGKVLKQIGYTSPLQFYDWVKANTTCDHALVLILSDLKGIGYAMNYAEGVDKETYFLEGCILYRNYPDGQELASSSIAHEFLHLFGAWDLYETFQQSKEHAEKAKQLFPNDVMRRTSYTINELEIGKLTAWAVGLTTAFEAWYEWFRP